MKHNNKSRYNRNNQYHRGLLSLFIFVIMCIGCFGCNGDDDSDGPATTPVIPVIMCEEKIQDPAPVENGELVYYSSQDKMIVIGNSYMQTWELQENYWRRVWTEHNIPSMRWFTVCDFPPAGELILLGESDVDTYNADETIVQMWSFNGLDWQLVVDQIDNLNITGTMVYDGNHERILYSGALSYYSYHSYSQVWQYDGISWEELEIDEGDSFSCTSTALGYDPIQDKMIMTCEYNYGCGGYSRSTIEFEENAWHITSTSDGPIGSMYYDPVADEMRLAASFYNYSYPGLAAYLFAYRDSAWELLDQADDFFIGTAAYNQGEQRLYTFTRPATLIYSDDIGWGDVSSDDAPGNFYEWTSAAYDPQLKKTIIVVENECFSDRIETWSWDGRTAKKMVASFEPNYYSHYEDEPYSMIYDQAGKRLLLFDQLCTVYELVDETWSEVHVANPHGCTDKYVAAYYPVDDAIVAYHHHNTFEFKDNQWRTIDTANYPTASLFGRMAYNEQSRKMVFFGGTNGVCYNETWEFDGNDWALRDMDSSPPFSYGGTLVYEPNLEGMLLVGGGCDRTLFPEAWFLDETSNTWIQLDIEGVKPARTFAASAYDRDRETLIIWGGEVNAGAKGSLLELSVNYLE